VTPRDLDALSSNRRIDPTTRSALSYPGVKLKRPSSSASKAPASRLRLIRERHLLRLPDKADDKTTLLDDEATLDERMELARQDRSNRIE
jgi:hypothetical protein